MKKVEKSVVEQNRGWSVLRVGEQREMGTWGVAACGGEVMVVVVVGGGGVDARN